MSQDNVADFARETFRKRLTSLIAAGVVTDADFADVIYAAQSQFGIDETQFRSGFALTAGAVERWCMRKNLPQPTVRPAILEWIMTQL